MQSALSHTDQLCERVSTWLPPLFCDNVSLGSCHGESSVFKVSTKSSLHALLIRFFYYVNCSWHCM